MRQNSKNNELRGVYDNVMLPNYSPANFVPKKAEGSLVWDQDDKEYIDFGGGIAVNSLGHSHPSLIKALTDQSKKIWHLSNYLTNEPAIKLANKLTELTFAENIFFNSLTISFGIVMWLFLLSLNVETKSSISIIL